MTGSISIANALKLTENMACKDCLHVTVLEKGKVQPYKDGKTFCEVVVADGLDCTRVFLYDVHNLQMFVVGSGIMMADFIVKTGFLVVTRMTDVFGSSIVDVPQDVQDKARNLMGRIMTVMEASTSPKKTAVKSIEGVVVKTTDVQTKRKRSTQEELSFKRARLRDETGMVEVCLWRDLAHTKIEKGRHVRLLHFEVTDCLDANNKATPAVCNKSASSDIELLPHTDKYDALLDLPEDLLEDVPPENAPSTIVGFGPINVYLSCPNQTCFKKKVINYKCPKCNVTYSETTVEKSVNGTLKVMGLPALHYFSQQAKELAEGLNIEKNITDSDFLKELVSKIPIQAQLKTKENKITSIKVIK